MNANVRSLIQFNTDLYAGGDLFTAGGATVNHIAKWTTATGMEESVMNNTIQVYPNPGNGIFSISFNNVMAEKSTVSIQNNMGEIIYSAPMRSPEMEIDLSKKARGFYYYTITSDKQTIGKGKLIVD